MCTFIGDLRNESDCETLNRWWNEDETTGVAFTGLANVPVHWVRATRTNGVLVIEMHHETALALMVKLAKEGMDMSVVEIETHKVRTTTQADRQFKPEWN